MICLDVVFLFPLLGLHWDSWIHRLMVFLSNWKIFSHYVLKHHLHPFPLFSSFVRWCRSQHTRSAVEVSVFKHTYTRTTDVLWGKRDGSATLSRGECFWLPLPLPQGGSAKSLALTSLYRFFRPLTSKKVLFYYTKVCFGWLSFADKRERMSLITSKEDICNAKGEMV